MGIAEEEPHGGKGGASATPMSSGPSGSEGCHLFGWLWAKLSATLGTPAAAALMRRAVSAAANDHPPLRGIAISRDRLTYTYRLPDELCSGDLENTVPIYQALTREVLRLTGELTGGVMVRGLVRSEELSPWLPNMQEVDEWLGPEE